MADVGCGTLDWTTILNILGIFSSSFDSEGAFGFDGHKKFQVLKKEIKLLRRAWVLTKFYLTIRVC